MLRKTLNQLDLTSGRSINVDSSSCAHWVPYLLVPSGAILITYSTGPHGHFIAIFIKGCMGILQYFYHFTKGDNFRYFLFASIVNETGVCS